MTQKSFKKLEIYVEAVLNMFEVLKLVFEVS